MMYLLSAFSIFVICSKETETSDFGPPHKRKMSESSYSEDDGNRFNMQVIHKRPSLELPIQRGIPISDLITQYYMKNIEFPSSPTTDALHSHDYFQKEQSQHLPWNSQLVIRSGEVNENEALRIGRQRQSEKPPERDFHREAFQMSRQRFGKYPPLIQVPANYWGTLPENIPESSDSEHQH